MMTRTPRILLAAVLAASLLVAGCSDDGDDEGAGNGSTTTAAEGPADDYAELCDVARSSMNASTSEQLAAAQAQMEVAPEELQEDYQVVVDLLTYRSENPADAAGIQERLDAAQAPTKRVIDAIERECGFNLFNPGA